MTFKRAWPWCAHVSSAGAMLLASCGGETEDFRTVQLALVGADTFLYFRCNATGWNVDGATRLREEATPGVFALSYDVSQGWMTGGGDDCVFTETNQQDGWGSSQSYYTSSRTPIRVPSGAAIGAGTRDPRNFRVIYPKLGRYRVTVDWNRKTFAIAEAPALASLLELETTEVDSAAHAVLQNAAPAAGESAFYLPPVAENIRVSADGTPLSHQRLVDPNSTDTIIQVEVPGGTSVLRIEYDQLDASLPYEGTWHLEHPAVTGPRRIVIQLPAGASVDRSNLIDTDPDPTRIVHDVPAGEAIGPFVAYRTPFIPDLYDHIQTPHFIVGLPIAYRRYQANVLGFLENVHALYAAYSEQDVNQIQGMDRYPIDYPPGGWLWGGVYELEGGLSVKGYSTVNARLVPAITLPASNDFNLMVAVTAHELGNGWWGLWEEPDPDNHTPSWINNEGHSGFLRSEAELDLGYCADARREYQNAYNSCPPSTCSDVNPVVLLTSLKARYGWDPLRAFYAAVQDGDFQLRGLSELERASVVIRFFAQHVGENLAPFFDATHVEMTPAVRAEISALPLANVPLIEPSQLACRPATLEIQVRLGH